MIVIFILGIYDPFGDISLPEILPTPQVHNNPSQKFLIKSGKVAVGFATEGEQKK